MSLLAQHEIAKLSLNEDEVLCADWAESLKIICEGRAGNNSVQIRLIEGLENRFVLRFQKRERSCLHCH